MIDKRMNDDILIVRHDHIIMEKKLKNNYEQITLLLDVRNQHFSVLFHFYVVHHIEADE
jgi:hypothetical protein